MIKSELINNSDQKEFSSRKKTRLSKEYYSLKKRIKLEIDTCCICGKKCNSFCKSHTIPQFILRSLSQNGKLFIGYNFQQTNFEKEHGVKNTLLFSCICKSCDNTYFQEYENPDSFKEKVNDIALNEIGVKIYLKHYYKRLWEKEVYLKEKEKNANKFIKNPAMDAFYDNRLLITDIDIKDAQYKIKKMLKKKNEKQFYVIDEIDLDYQTEMAFQGFINLSQGFDGVINDLFNYDPKYKMELLFVCVFPFSGKTKIIIFCEDGVKRLRRFYKEYKKLNIKEKLYVLNYIILLYDEEWCVSTSFKKSSLNKETIWLINQRTDFFFEGDDLEELYQMQKQIRDLQMEMTYRIQTKGNIYNFLEEKK